MQDYGEYTPLDAVSADGTPGHRTHNRCPVLHHCPAAEVASPDGRPLGRFIRSGFTDVAPCADIVWGGDPTTGWDDDGLASSVRNGLTMGLSGISLWGSDIGGLFANGLNRLTPELKVRWIALGAVSGVMRDKAGQLAIPDTDDKVRPQIWDPEILPNWRRYAKLGTQLHPYRRTADQNGSQAPSGRQRSGGREVTVPAPLGELSLLVHAGAVLPLLPATVQTLADHGPASLERPGDEQRLLAFPRGVSESRFLDEGRLRSVERDRGNPARALTIAGDAPRTYDLEASPASLERPFVPCHVTVDGRLLPGEDWSYDGAVQVVSLQVAGAQVEIEVRACGGGRRP